MTKVKSPVEQKIESLRALYKERTKLKDKDFDNLLKTLNDPQKVLSYLKGRLDLK